MKKTLFLALSALAFAGGAFAEETVCGRLRAAAHQDWIDDGKGGVDLGIGAPFAPVVEMPPVNTCVCARGTVITDRGGDRSFKRVELMSPRQESACTQEGL